VSGTSVGKVRGRWPGFLGLFRTMWMLLTQLTSTKISTDSFDPEVPVCMCVCVVCVVGD
jgi:hypothetical protein